MLFHHFLFLFVGSSPTQGEFFVWILVSNGLFFIYSNTLKSHLINLRGQDNLKTQKMREIGIAIYLCNIELVCLYTNIKMYNLDLSNPGPFFIFFPNWTKKWWKNMKIWRVKFFQLSSKSQTTLVVYLKGVALYYVNFLAFNIKMSHPCLLIWKVY